MTTNILEPTTRTLWAIYWAEQGTNTPTLTITQQGNTAPLTCSTDTSPAGIEGFVIFINTQSVINALGQLGTGSNFLIHPAATPDSYDNHPHGYPEHGREQEPELPPFSLTLTDRDYELLLTQPTNPEDTEPSPF